MSLFVPFDNAAFVEQDDYATSEWKIEKVDLQKKKEIWRLYSGKQLDSLNNKISRLNQILFL